MIRLKYKDFRGDFLPTFDRLMGAPGLNQRVAYNLAKLSKPLRAAASEAQTEFLKLVNLHGLKDEAGELVPLDGPGTFQVDPKNKDAWEKDITAFENKEVTLDRHPFMVADFAQATLTPNDYIALEPLIVELGAVDDLPPAPVPSQPMKLSPKPPKRGA